jgi:hypothetical protein
MSLEAWQAFRQGETVREIRLICTECGCPAQGNASWTDGSGEVCDKCVEEDQKAEPTV